MARDISEDLTARPRRGAPPKDPAAKRTAQIRYQIHEAWMARLEAVVARLRVAGGPATKSGYIRAALAEQIQIHARDLGWPASVLEGAGDRPGATESAARSSVACTEAERAALDAAVETRLRAGIPTEGSELVRAAIVAQVEADEAALARPAARASLRTARRSTRATSRRRADEACAAPLTVRGRRRDANLAQSVEQRFRKPARSRTVATLQHHDAPASLGDAA